MDTVSESRKTQVCSGIKYCTQIVINDKSRFSKLPYMKSLYKQAQLVSEDNGLREYGYVVTLEESSRKSSLEVFDTVFKEIKAPVDGCLPYESLIAID